MPADAPCARMEGSLALAALGALPEAEWAVVGPHLATCAGCRAALRDLEATAGLMAALGPEAAAQVAAADDAPPAPPFTTLARSTLGPVVAGTTERHVPIGPIDRPRFIEVAEATRRRARRNRLLAAVAAVALLAAGTTAWRFTLTSAARRPPAVATLASSNAMHLVAHLEPKGWGTEVTVIAGGARTREGLDVWLGAPGRGWVDAGSFSTVPGKTIRVTMACDAHWAGITTIEVRTGSGRVVASGSVDL